MVSAFHPTRVPLPPSPPPHADNVQIAPEELALIYNLRKVVRNDWVSTEMLTRFRRQCALTSEPRLLHAKTLWTERSCILLIPVTVPSLKPTYLAFNLFTSLE